MSIPTFERVTWREPGRRSRTIFLRNPREVSLRGTPTFLTGTEVDREGDEVGGAVTQIHLLSLDLVTKRTPVTIDWHFGLLLADGEEA